MHCTNIQLVLLCNENGHFLSSTTSPPAHEPLDATPQNPCHLFEDRLSFKFANYHFSLKQTSGASIDKALQLWATQSAKNSFNDIPWQSADNMYHTIDQIQQGDNPWRAIPLRFQVHCAITHQSGWQKTMYSPPAIYATFSMSR